jgi:hypothetical protein
MLAAFPRKRPALSLALRITVSLRASQSVATNHCTEKATALPQKEEEMSARDKRGFLGSQTLPIIKKPSRGA